MAAMHDGFDNLRRRAVHRRQNSAAATDPFVFPGGGSGPKFPAPQTSTSTPAATSAPQQTSAAPTSTAAAAQSTAAAAAPQSSSPAAAAPAAASSSPPSSSATPTSTSISTSTTISSTTTSSSSSVAAPTVASATRGLTSAPAAVAGAQSIAYVYESSTASLDASFATSSPSATAAASSGANTGAIVGGVIAGVVAVIGILFGIFYFVRKRRSDEDDVLGNWDPDTVRRQSRMLDEPEMSGPNTNMFGGNSSLRPPTMIERHVNNASPMLARQRSFGQPYDQPAMQPAFDHNGYPINNGYPVAAGFGAPVTYSAGPDDYMNNMPPVGNPFMSPYEQPMASPVSSTVPQYDSYAEPAPPQGAVTRQPSQLARQQSFSSPQEGDSYADVSRTSVTPFQAQQYAEINNKLNTPVLGAVAEEHPAPPPAALAPGRVSPTHASPVQPIARASPPATTEAKRPDTMYSAIYDEEDAYGGI